MFTDIFIENFQKHKDTHIPIKEGVNVITGSSDTGKSSVIRAIRWLLNNRPSGEAFKNWDALKKDDVSVSITLKEGLSAILTRRNGKNTYSVITEEGEEIQRFEAIGMDVPEEITKLFDLEDYNIQTQHDSYFLLNDSPGEVARKLNELTGLSVIDKLYSFISSKHRETKTKISQYTNERDALETRLEQYKDLDTIKKILDSIEKTQREADATASSLSLLENLAHEYSILENERQIDVEFIAVEDAVNSLLKTIDDYETTEQFINKLTDANHLYHKTTVALSEDQVWADLETEQKELFDEVLEIIFMESQLGNLSRHKFHLDQLSEEIKTDQRLIVSTMDEYKRLLKESGMCPMCGSKVDKKVLSQIEELIA